MRLAESERECAGLGGPWFVPLLLDAIPRWVHRHARTDSNVRIARAHELGEIVACSQGAAAIADPDARGTEQEGAAADVFNAIAEGLAIGAYCPGGALFAGVCWQVEGPVLRETRRAFCTAYPLDDDEYWRD